MSTGSGSDAMTIYMKFNRQTGKCTMRFEGAGCSEYAGKHAGDGLQRQGAVRRTQSNPNQVSSDAKVDCALLDESVTVPGRDVLCNQVHGHVARDTHRPHGLPRASSWSRWKAVHEGGSTSMVLNAYG